MIQETIIVFIAALLLLEGMLVLIFPKQITKLIKRLIKNENQFKLLGMIEALIGLALLLSLILK